MTQGELTKGEAECGRYSRSRRLPQATAIFDATDPTGTRDLSDRFRADLDRRWGQLARLTTDAILTKGLFKPTAELLLHGDPIWRFRRWMGDAASQTVLGGSRTAGSWAATYIAPATQKGATDAGAASARVLDGEPILATVQGLQQLVKDTASLAADTFEAGMAASARPGRIAQDIAKVIRVGQTRSRQMASWTVVKAYNGALLDELKLQGVTHVGVVAEHHRHRVRDYDPDQPRDWHGRFESVGSPSISAIKAIASRSEQRAARFIADPRGEIIAAGDAADWTHSSLADEHGTTTLYNPDAPEENSTPLLGYVSHDRQRDKHIFTIDTALAYGAVTQMPSEMRAGKEKLEARLEKHGLVNPRRWLEAKVKDAPRERAQPREKKSGRFRTYKKAASGYRLRKAHEEKRRVERLGGEGGIDVVTAGDDLVCPICEEIADQGPYAIDEAQSLIPAHPNCRCTFAPAAQEALDYNPLHQPGGSPGGIGGEFAPKGAGAGEGTESAKAGYPASSPVTDVGGDKWNRQTAVRLEDEYQDAKPALDALAAKIPAPPEHFDPLSDVQDQNYNDTQAFARRMAMDRAVDLIAERGLTPIGVTYDEMRARVLEDDARLWSGWKSDSADAAGQLLQKATADELGGRLNEDRMKFQGNFRSPIEMANNVYRDIGGYEGVKAYVRAKWETAQWMMEKAGVDELKLYRGIYLKDTKEWETARTETVGDWQHFDRLPDLRVRRNGAASTTLTASVANSWGNSKQRVVLRALVPRTAAISIPAFGQNTKNEKEVVIAGTAWKGWDAWKNTAPLFDVVPMTKSKSIVDAEPKLIIVDLMEHGNDWLQPHRRAAGVRDYDPEQPRDPHGRWTSGGAAPEGGSINEEMAVAARAANEKAARETADKLGYDQSRLHFFNELPGFELNGQQMRAAGYAVINDQGSDMLGWHWQKGDILVNAKSSMGMPGLVAHEVEHQKYQAVMDAWVKEDSAAVRELNIDWQKNKPPGAPDPFKADGTLRSPFDEKYPLTQAVRQAHARGDDTRWRDADGVSDYSYQWWTAAHDGKASEHQAIHETLAEMARIKNETGKFPEHMGERIISWRTRRNPPPNPLDAPPKPPKAEIAANAKAWRDLYRLVEEFYPKVPHA